MQPCSATTVEHACARCQDQTGTLHMFCDTNESESCLVKAPAKHASESVCTGVQAYTERHKEGNARNVLMLGYKQHILWCHCNHACLHLESCRGLWQSSEGRNHVLARPVKVHPLGILQAVSVHSVEYVGRQVRERPATRRNCSSSVSWPNMKRRDPSVVFFSLLESART